MIPECKTCRHDVPLKERNGKGPLCRHPDAETDGFWDCDISECYTPKTDGAQ